MENQEPTGDMSRSNTQSQPKTRGKVMARLKWGVGGTVLAVLLLVAVREGRKENNRMRAENNLRTIILAVHKYAAVNQDHLPPAGIYRKDGEPLLSWRVILLPYLGEEALYKEFKLDEPWDSPHNHRLLARMPEVFQHPGVTTQEPFTTYYRIFAGKNTLFPGPQGECEYTMKYFRDWGRRFFAVEAADAVPWTKPDELTASPPFRFGQPASQTFFVVMMDGSVIQVKKTVSDVSIRIAIGRDSNEDDF